MKKYFATILVVSTVLLSYGQINFRTGDPQFERELNVLNAKAKTDLEAFKQTIVKQHEIGIQQVENVLSKVSEPVEALLAFRLATITKTPINQVITTYSVNRDKGWGKMAQEMGIKPGSPEFHALKNGKKQGLSGGFTIGKDQSIVQYNKKHPSKPIKINGHGNPKHVVKNQVKSDKGNPQKNSSHGNPGSKGNGNVSHGNSGNKGNGNASHGNSKSGGSNGKGRK